MQRPLVAVVLDLRRDTEVEQRRDDIGPVLHRRREDGFWRPQILRVCRDGSRHRFVVQTQTGGDEFPLVVWSDIDPVCAVPDEQFGDVGMASIHGELIGAQSRQRRIARRCRVRIRAMGQAPFC
jgi:hypothetical protein